jgi:hypothetical protein
MFQHIVLLVLVAYPVLCLIPFNLIRFRWGFMNGSAPMPTEIEAKAEVADRTALFVFHLMLFVLIAASMRGSSISLDEVGLSLANWQRALGMGLMFSLFIVVLGELFLSRVSPEDKRKEAESRGPVAVWCGIVLSGSFSLEIWRAFCIVALMRSGCPAWLAIVLTTLFSAAVWLQRSVATALGAAAVGCAAGFLFVDSGSLLAPVSMGIIAGLTNLYHVRHARSGAPRASSRFSRPCPACGEAIRLSEVRWAGDMITCPSCGECLTTKKKYLWAIGAISVGVAGYVMRRFISGDPGYFLVAEAIALVLFFILAVCFSLIIPPTLKRVQGRAFDKELSLFGTDQPDDSKKRLPK